ncbi:MAG TPA: hypothetical protein VHQ97_08390 [Solirubrobacterales bacterium]|jgi:hypothetical protein|nr:hypothetical protein [Solirubrobacterales bacterium]
MRRWLPVAALAALLLIPAASPAATVVNGDFETGNLSGWQVHNSTPEGDWFVYSGTKTPLEKRAEEEALEEAENEEEEQEVIESFPPFFPPPQGGWAAATDENQPDTAILYQDIALEPYYSHLLTMTFYYHSQAPIRVPNPDTLSVTPPPPPEEEDGPTQQQVRVDVMRPTAPIESLNPSDILVTLFANRNGDPETMAPTQLSANLTPFAGQTVRLRFANAVNDFVFNAGVDAVSVTSTPPSNVFTKGKLKLNRKKGTATLTVTVPGAGVLTLADAGGTKKATASKKKRKPKLLKPATVNATAAGTVKVPLKPTGAGKRILRKRGKLRFKASLSFTPTGGFAGSQSLKGTLKLKRK